MHRITYMSSSNNSLIIAHSSRGWKPKTMELAKSLVLLQVMAKSRGAGSKRGRDGAGGMAWSYDTLLLMD